MTGTVLPPRGNAETCVRATFRWLLILLACLSLGAAESGNAERGGGRKGEAGGDKGHQQPPPFVFYADVPTHDFDIILGRPTRSAITLSVLAYSPMEGSIFYSPDSTGAKKTTPLEQFVSGEPKEIVIDGLEPDTEYHYHLHWRAPGAETYIDATPGRFHTPRRSGAAFRFTVQADSHLDHPQAPALYAATLRAIIATNSDFHIDLGDTFMTDKRRQEFRSALPQYLAQRYYFGQICQSGSLFLVLGNHDGEAGNRFNDNLDSMPGWSNTMRKRYFPNPVPNDFYTGNATPLAPLGLLQDYYAWEWGNALFVVLDPYWFTKGAARGAGGYWDRSLGDEQYHWLSKTVLSSKAAFKFVFIHNLVGGVNASMRGGAEAAQFFEWGGRNLDGTESFATHRPGWEEPVHALLKHAGVDVVFHGHDHFFARQEYDGVVYQLVPQPSNPGNREIRRMASEYGYVTGDFLAGPGFLKVQVDEKDATVTYFRTPSNPSESAPPEDVFQYQISANRETGPAAPEVPQSKE